MGTHGRRGFDRLLLGSATDRMMRMAPCPVLAVREATLASDLAFVLNASRVRPECCVDPLRPPTLTDSYSKLRHDVEFRKRVALKVGLGFELPSPKAVVGPNGPKIEVGAVQELAVNY